MGDLIKLPNAFEKSPLLREAKSTIHDIIISRKNLVEVAADAVEYAVQNMSSVENRVKDIAKDHDYLLKGAVEDVDKPDNVIRINRDGSRSGMTIDAREKLERIHAVPPEEGAEILDFKARAERAKAGDYTTHVERKAA